VNGEDPHGGGLGTRPVYLLIDSSGSTVRNGFLNACHAAMPAVIAELERHGAGGRVLVCMLRYGDDASVYVALQPVQNLSVIPPLVPSGLSSLAAGLRLLARRIEDDAGQLAADGVRYGTPVAVVLADGLPTDRAADVLAARAALDEEHPWGRPALTVAMPGQVDELAVAGLGARFHRLDDEAPGRLEASVVSAVAVALAAALPAG
jgi:hypothetical protein